MSPEQARGEPATAASDAFALGLLLQELFTGRPPYPADLPEPLLLVKAADGDTLPLDGVGDPSLAALIQRLTAVAPEARPTVAEAAERLAWLRGKPRRRRLLLLAAAVAVLFLLGGVQSTLDLREQSRKALEARREAEQEAARADAVLAYLEGLFEASDPRNARGRVPDVHELLDRGIERLDEERSLEDQPLPAGTTPRYPGRHPHRARHLRRGPCLCWKRRSPSVGGSAATRIRRSRTPWCAWVRWPSLSGRGDAVALFRRALAIREAQPEPALAEVADVLNKLGTTLAAHGRLDDAERVLRRSLDLHETLWGSDDPRVAKVLHNLAGIAYARGRTEESEALLRRALAIRQATLPEDHPDLAGSREALALLLLERGEAAEAVAILERLAASAETIYGKDHPELARTLLNLGLARARLGQDAAALRLYEKPLAIAEKSLEPGHPQLVRTRQALADQCSDGREALDADSRALCRRHGL